MLSLSMPLITHSPLMVILSQLEPVVGYQSCVVGGGGGGGWLVRFVLPLSKTTTGSNVGLGLNTVSSSAKNT